MDWERGWSSSKFDARVQKQTSLKCTSVGLSCGEIHPLKVVLWGATNLIRLHKCTFQISLSTHTLGQKTHWATTCWSGKSTHRVTCTLAVRFEWHSLLITGLAALKSYVPQLIEHSLRMLILVRGGSKTEGGEEHNWEKGTHGVLLQAISGMMSTGVQDWWLIEKQVELKLCHRPLHLCISNGLSFKVLGKGLRWLYQQRF
jgi:hypothetical protein